MDKRADLAIALSVVLMGILVLLESGRVTVGVGIVDPVSPVGLPRALAAVLIALGLVVVIVRLRTWNAQPGWIVEAEGEEDEPDFPTSFIRPLLVGVVAIAYLQFLPLVGFILLTPLLLAAELAVLGVRDRRQLVGVAIGFTIVLYLGFGLLLGVRLPEGPFYGMF